LTTVTDRAQISYELNNRPDWIRVPIPGVLQMLVAQA
jgi:predicted trehalose synthase